MVTGAILAGGSHLIVDDQPMGLLHFEGQPLIRYLIDQMLTICTEVMIITHDPFLYLPIVDKRVRVLTDFYPSEGALSGIYTALALAKKEYVWMVSLNRPFLCESLLKLQLDHMQPNDSGIVALERHGQSLPYPALYRKTVKDAILPFLKAKEYDPYRFLAKYDHTVIEYDLLHLKGIDERCLHRISTQASYAEALRILHTPIH